MCFTSRFIDWERGKRQLKAFKRKEKHFLDTEALKRHFPFLEGDYFAFHYPHSLCLHCPSYLKALSKGLKKRGVSFITHHLDSLEELKDFDGVFIAAGYGCLKLLSANRIQAHGLHLVKGQVLTYKPLEGLYEPLVGKKYLVPQGKGREVIAGASFEKDFKDLKPHHSPAIETMQEQLEELYPPLKAANFQSIKASARLCSSSHSPLWGRLDSRTYLLTALGSKGLLTHSLLAQKLALAYNRQKKPPELLGATLIWE